MGSNSYFKALCQTTLRTSQTTLIPSWEMTRWIRQSEFLVNCRINKFIWTNSFWILAPKRNTKTSKETPTCLPQALRQQNPTWKIISIGLQGRIPCLIRALVMLIALDNLLATWPSLRKSSTDRLGQSRILSLRRRSRDKKIIGLLFMR